jgi:hypothetical protein
MDTLLDQLFEFIDFSLSPAGLMIQSLFIIIITLTTLSLLNAARAQIAQRDLQRARHTFYWMLALQVLVIVLHLSKSLDWWAIPTQIMRAVQDVVWTLNLILVGWLWIKPIQQPQFSIYQKIFILTALGLFSLQTFQVIEFVFSPLAVSVPYELIWKSLDFLIGFFLFFSYFKRAGNLLWGSILFVTLHILGLGINSILAIPLLFTRNIAQVIAFLFIPQLFRALSFDIGLLEKKEQVVPTLLSENMAVMPAPQLITAWLHTVLQNDNKIPPYALCKALASTFFADECLIVERDDPKQVIKILCGFALKPSKQIPPRAIPLEHEIVIQQKSVLFHGADAYPLWIKNLLARLHFSRAQSVWYIPLPVNQHHTLLFLISRHLLWNQEHIEMSKHILPYLVQILQNYFHDDTADRKQAEQMVESSNPFLDLMKTEIDYGSDPQQIEQELKLALEEYNRIRKILEERGIGQSL